MTLRLTGSQSAVLQDVAAEHNSTGRQHTCGLQQQNVQHHTRDAQTHRPIVDGCSTHEPDHRPIAHSGRPAVNQDDTKVYQRSLDTQQVYCPDDEARAQRARGKEAVLGAHSVEPEERLCQDSHTCGPQQQACSAHRACSGQTEAEEESRIGQHQSGLQQQPCRQLQQSAHESRHVCDVPRTASQQDNAVQRPTHQQPVVLPRQQSSDMYLEASPFQGPSGAQLVLPTACDHQSHIPEQPGRQLLRTSKYLNRFTL